MSEACVHIVDDDASFRASIVFLLESAGLATRTYDSAEAFLQEVPQGPGCILMDLTMPGLSGLELQRELAHRVDVPPIVFLTAFGDVRAGVSAMRAGAEDFLTKPVDAKELLDALSRALSRDEQQRDALARAGSLQQRGERLSAREREVLMHVAAGRLNKQIAFDLNLALQTVKFHRGNVMTKLDASSTAELVLMAAQLGLAPKPSP
jgi:FixJ family two-component response regulator